MPKRKRSPSSSPPPQGNNNLSNTNGNGAPALPGGSSYSSLVTPPPAPASQGKRDIAHPFRYSRDEMLQVWKDGGSSASTLPIEVERWEGVVKESAGEPACLREFSEEEKKVGLRSFSGLSSLLRVFCAHSQSYFLIWTGCIERHMQLL